MIRVLSGPVYSFALRLCGNREAAEDITQETFLAVWRNIRTFKAKSRFSTWVFGIAYRQCLMHRRQSPMETVELNEDWPEPSDSMETVLEAALLWEAVRNLPETYRDAVLLVNYQGLTYREAAGVVDVPIGTLKSRMNYAFKLLREQLAEGEVDEREMRQSQDLSR